MTEREASELESCSSATILQFAIRIGNKQSVNVYRWGEVGIAWVSSLAKASRFAVSKGPSQRQSIYLIFRTPATQKRAVSKEGVSIRV